MLSSTEALLAVIFLTTRLCWTLNVCPGTPHVLWPSSQSPDLSCLSSSPFLLSVISFNIFFCFYFCCFSLCGTVSPFGWEAIVFFFNWGKEACAFCINRIIKFVLCFLQLLSVSWKYFCLQYELYSMLCLHYTLAINIIKSLLGYTSNNKSVQL